MVELDPLDDLLLVLVLAEPPTVTGLSGSRLVVVVFLFFRLLGAVAGSNQHQSQNDGLDKNKQLLHYRSRRC